MGDHEELYHRYDCPESSDDSVDGENANGRRYKPMIRNGVNIMNKSNVLCFASILFLQLIRTFILNKSVSF